jgi:hypothetical protein
MNENGGMNIVENCKKENKENLMENEKENCFIKENKVYLIREEENLMENEKKEKKIIKKVIYSKNHKIKKFTKFYNDLGDSNNFEKKIIRFDILYQNFEKKLEINEELNFEKINFYNNSIHIIDNYFK